MGALEFHGAVGFPPFVHQQRKCDPRFRAESLRIPAVAESHRRERSSPLTKARFARAQLRDVLAAEDSTVVAQEDDDRRLMEPKRAEAKLAAVRVGQLDHCQSAVERALHANHCEGRFEGVKRAPGGLCRGQGPGILK